jgi:hypothetical protein
VSRSDQVPLRQQELKPPSHRGFAQALAGLGRGEVPGDKAEDKVFQIVNLFGSNSPPLAACSKLVG